jgi:hypothetical protein
MYNVLRAKVTFHYQWFKYFSFATGFIEYVFQYGWFNMKMREYNFKGFGFEDSLNYSFQLQHQRSGKHEPHIRVRMYTTILSHIRFNSITNDI